MGWTAVALADRDCIGGAIRDRRGSAMLCNVARRGTEASPPRGGIGAPQPSAAWAPACYSPKYQRRRRRPIHPRPPS